MCLNPKVLTKKKRGKINGFATEFVARATGLEPVTYGLTANPARVKNRRNLRFFNGDFSPCVDLV